MKRSLSLLLMAIILLLPAKAYSLEKVRVLVLPFEIHSQKEVSHLKKLEGLEPRVPKAEKASEPKPYQYYMLTSNMNLRKKSNTDSGIKLVMKKGEEFQILDEYKQDDLNTWHFIKTKSGLTGWFCGIYNGKVMFKRKVEETPSIEVEETPSIETEIQRVLKTHFEQNGAIVIETDFSLENQPKSITGMRNLGIKSGADYVVWGSLTWIEQKFSIDAKMIESFNNKQPNILFVEGEGIENLFGSVKKLAENLGIRLFMGGKVAKVLVEGNKRIETDAIKKYIKTKPGDIFNTKNISEDLKSIYSMGYF